MSEWYAGQTRRERVRDALRRHELDVLLAITPENAGYLAGQSNFIATHWRIPGIYSAAISEGGELAVVSGDFAADPQSAQPFTLIPYRSWTESIDVRAMDGPDLADRIAAARPGPPIPRPVQFDLDAVFDAVLEAVQVVAPRARKLGVDLRDVDAGSVQRLVSRLPGVAISDATTILDDSRALKDADEIDHLRLAGELTEIGIRGALSRLAPGMTESALNSAYQVAVHDAVIADRRFGAFRQAEGLANIGIGVDSPRVVAPGQTLKFDMQVDIAGYHSDIGRTFAIQPTADQRALFTVLRAALATLQDAVRPGR